MIRFISPPADAPFRRLYSPLLRKGSVQAARRRSTSRWRRPQTAERARVPPLRNEPDHLALWIVDKPKRRTPLAMHRRECASADEQGGRDKPGGGQAPALRRNRYNRSK